jgi:ATP-dependent Clp protease adapter protein ClpS
MDYKRAYEELRDVYLKDKQTADELAELVRVHLSLLDKHRDILNLDSYTQSHYSITLLQKHIGESETTLRKAVGKD